MKAFLLVGSLLFAVSSWANTCRISSVVFVPKHCESYSTKVAAVDLEACRTIAHDTRKDKFFHVLDADSRVINTKFVYKEKGKDTVKEKIEFENHDEVCN
jgi:hypothetical protein